jgi:hypothetical protein
VVYAYRQGTASVRELYPQTYEELRGGYYHYLNLVEDPVLALDEKELRVDEGDAEGTAGNGDATGEI